MSDAPKHMMAAIPDGAVFVKHQTGSTWNDGGRWHNVFFKRPDGTGGVIRMPTDYRHLDLEVEDWQPPEPTYTRAEVEAARREGHIAGLREANTEHAKRMIGELCEWLDEDEDNGALLLAALPDETIANLRTILAPAAEVEAEA